MRLGICIVITLALMGCDAQKDARTASQIRQWSIANQGKVKVRFGTPFATNIAIFTTQDGFQVNEDRLAIPVLVENNSDEKLVSVTVNVTVMNPKNHGDVMSENLMLITWVNKNTEVAKIYVNDERVAKSGLLSCLRDLGGEPELRFRLEELLPDSLLGSGVHIAEAVAILNPRITETKTPSIRDKQRAWSLANITNVNLLIGQPFITNALVYATKEFGPSYEPRLAVLMSVENNTDEELSEITLRISAINPENGKEMLSESADFSTFSYKNAMIERVYVNSDYLHRSSLQSCFNDLGGKVTFKYQVEMFTPKSLFGKGQDNSTNSVWRRDW